MSKELREQSFEFSVATETGTQGTVHYRSERVVTLANAEKILESKLKEADEFSKKAYEAGQNCAGDYTYAPYEEWKMKKLRNHE